MANSLLTPNQVTREALRILHQKCNFVGNVNRQYDKRFAVDGAKIGTSLDVRLPNKYTIRTGSTLSAQDTVERVVTLPCATQKGVDLNFTSVDLTMSLDDFSRRILEPAMAVLAANIESDAFSMYKDVHHTAGTVGTQIDYKKFQQAGQKLTESLAPRDNMRTMTLDPASCVEFSDAVKGLFQDSDNIAKQYKEGKVGRTAGFNVYENTLIPAHTPGTHTTGSTPLVDGASQGNAGTNNAFVSTTDLVTDGWAASTAVLKEGDIITITGVNSVHPETRADTGNLQQFVVQEDVTSTAGGAATFEISPAIITGGAYQTVTASPADNAAITPFGTEDVAFGQNLAFHRDAFIFATADLIDVSRYGAWGAREVYDGISMRLARQYDINNDQIPARIDVLYGYVAPYPELACRLVHQL